MPATAMILSSPQCLQRGELFRQRPQPATCLRSQHRVPILLHDRGERRRRARNGGDRAHAKAAVAEGSARVSRAGFGVAPKRTFLDLITIRTVRPYKKVREREDALANSDSHSDSNIYSDSNGSKKPRYDP